MISFIFAIEMITFVILYYFKSIREKSYIHPELIFLLAYILVTSAYFFQKSITNNSGGMFFMRGYVEKTVIITFGGFISYVLVFVLMELRKGRERKVFVIESDKRYIKRYYRVSLFLCYCITLLNIVMYYVSGAFTRVRGEGQFEADEAAVTVAQFSVFQLLLILILVQLSYIMYGKIQKMILILLGIMFIIAAILGERQIIILSILGMLIIKNSYKRIKIKTIVFITFGGLLFNYILTMIRIMERSNGVLNNIRSLSFGVVDVIRRVCETLACSDIDTLITSLYINSDKLLYGKSYLGSVVNVLFPKNIFGFYFFEPISVTFRKDFYSNVTSVGYDFTLVSESIMNFGCLGPIIIMGVLALLLYKLSRNININDIFMPLKVLIAMRIMFALRTDSNGIVKIVVYSTLFFLFLIFILGKTHLVKKES